MITEMFRVAPSFYLLHALHYVVKSADCFQN